MPPQDGGRWLRALLAGEGVPVEVLSSLGARSCKATVFIWAAKGGLGVSSRRLLGYHTKPGGRSVIEYSRDELASPLRELEELYAAIKLG
eukprot:4557495-Alexandrium_andersonii.AAC.1